MKKKLIIGFSLLGLFGLAGCNNESNSTTTIPSNNEPSTSTEASTPSQEASTSAVRNKPADLANATLWIVGDSTVDEFLDASGNPKDTTYFYERCGWGGHIKDYSTDKLTVKNYGASGRSSKDYLQTSYYTTIENSIAEGDFLMIGFGHNDEKSDDPARFTNATLATDNNASFKYYLYEYYIKLAEEAGATPILCTPIVRLDTNDNYTGSSAHITSTGDYRQAIVELGEEKDVKVIDLTTYTKNLYTSLGHEEASYFHAMTSGLSAEKPNLSSVDKTHINNYGAKTFDYFITNELYTDSECYLGNYIKDERVKPTRDNDLVVNASYKYTPYKAPDLSKYNPGTQFTTTTEGWYGTAFGDCGGDPASAGNGYYATETSDGVFKVGQSKDEKTYYKGKIASSSEGLAFLFKQVSINDNFNITVDAKILTVNGDGKQDGFGLMLRDACWLPKNDSALLSNYVAAGILRSTSTDIVANFSRASESAITKSSNTLSAGYQVNDTLTLSISRVGQSVTVTTIYKGTTYTTNYLDFDFVAKDSDYFYIGMFAARGTIVEFTNLNYEKTGESQGA